jgi:hypothetical protein
MDLHREGKDKLLKLNALIRRFRDCRFLNHALRPRLTVGKPYRQVTLSLSNICNQLETLEKLIWHTLCLGEAGEHWGIREPFWGTVSSLQGVRGVIGSANSRESRSLSIRRSILIWIGGAVVGWAAAIIAIYAFLRLGGV